MTIKINKNDDFEMSKLFIEDQIWADGILENSNFADTFEAVDYEFEPTTGEYKYFDEAGNYLIIDQDANILVGEIGD